MADELTTEGHTQSENIRARQRRVTQLWKDLQVIIFVIFLGNLFIFIL